MARQVKAELGRERGGGPSRTGRGTIVLGVALCAAAASAVPLVGFAGQETAGDECLVEVHDHGGDVPDGSTLCQVASRKICTFSLQLCRNQPGCVPASSEKAIGTTGHCSPGRLRITKAQSSCGSFVDIKVRTKRNGKRMQACTIRVAAKSRHKPARMDVDGSRPTQGGVKHLQVVAGVGGGPLIRQSKHVADDPVMRRTHPER